jgi:membrane fusion protein (multidrug efflux system)
MKKLIFLAVSVVFAACGIETPKPVQTSFPTMTISKSDIMFPLKYSATLKGTSDVTIKPQVSGQLMEVCITEGQQVKKGDVLFRIDSRNAQLELESAEANLAAAIASESSARLEYESSLNLYNKGIVSKYMLESAENSYKSAQASVIQYQAAANRARVNLSYCTITAPVDGLIGSVPVFAGDQVAAGTYLTMVSGNAKMYAEFSVNESILEERAHSEIKDNETLLAGLPDATFLFKNGAEYPLKGRITSITGTVDRTTGTLTCKATFPNPDGGLYSGVQGTVVVPFDINDVMVVPQNAVVRLQNKSLVYKVGADSCAYSVIVTTENFSSERDLVITSGLEVGDVIVTQGANNVVEGQRVIF